MPGPNESDEEIDPNEETNPYKDKSIDDIIKEIQGKHGQDDYEDLPEDMKNRIEELDMVNAILAGMDTGAFPDFSDPNEGLGLDANIPGAESPPSGNPYLPPDTGTPGVDPVTGGDPSTGIDPNVPYTMPGDPGDPFATPSEIIDMMGGSIYYGGDVPVFIPSSEFLPDPSLPEVGLDEPTTTVTIVDDTPNEFPAIETIQDIADAAGQQEIVTINPAEEVPSQIPGLGADDFTAEFDPSMIEPDYPIVIPPPFPTEDDAASSTLAGGSTTGGGTEGEEANEAANNAGSSNNPIFIVGGEGVPMEGGGGIPAGGVPGSGTTSGGTGTTGGATSGGTTTTSGAGSTGGISASGPTGGFTNVGGGDPGGGITGTGGSTDQTAAGDTSAAGDPADAGNVAAASGDAGVDATTEDAGAGGEDETTQTDDGSGDDTDALIRNLTNAIAAGNDALAQEIYNKLTETVGVPLSDINDALAGVGSSLADVLVGIDASQEDIEEAIESGTTTLGEAIESGLVDLGEGVSADLEALEDQITSGQTTIQDLVNDGTLEITNAISESQAALEQAIESGNLTLQDAIEAGLIDVSEGVSDNLDALESALTAGQTTIQDMIDAGLVSIAQSNEETQQAIDDLGIEVIDKIDETQAAIDQTFQEIADAAGVTVDELKQQIKDAENGLDGALTGIAAQIDKLPPALQALLEPFLDSIGNSISTLSGDQAASFTDVLNAVADANIAGVSATAAAAAATVEGLTSIYDLINNGANKIWEILNPGSTEQVVTAEDLKEGYEQGPGIDRTGTGDVIGLESLIPGVDFGTGVVGGVTGSTGETYYPADGANVVIDEPPGRRLTLGEIIDPGVDRGVDTSGRPMGAQNMQLYPGYMGQAQRLSGTLDTYPELQRQASVEYGVNISTQFPSLNDQQQSFFANYVTQKIQAKEGLAEDPGFLPFDIYNIVAPQLNDVLNNFGTYDYQTGRRIPGFMQYMPQASTNLIALGPISSAGSTGGTSAATGTTYSTYNPGAMPGGSI